MKYSSGLAVKTFWYLESKKTTKYMLKGLTREEIREIAVKENIYQVGTKNRSLTIFNTVYSRLNSLPEYFLEDIINSDITTSKILVLISIMKTDRLFFEFMHEVFRNNIIVGDYSIKDRDLNVFFDEKKVQSEIIDNWNEETIKKLKSRYMTVLNFAGLIRVESDKREILIPHIDYRVKQRLIYNKLGPYIYAITGEK